MISLSEFSCKALKKKTFYLGEEGPYYSTNKATMLGTFL
jgi:hypothetical protein